VDGATDGSVGRGRGVVLAAGGGVGSGVIEGIGSVAVDAGAGDEAVTDGGTTEVGDLSGAATEQAARDTAMDVIAAIRMADRSVRISASMLSIVARPPGNPPRSKCRRRRPLRPTWHR